MASTTLCVIKPHAVSKGYAPAIEKLLEEKKFAVVARAEVHKKRHTCQTQPP